MLLDQVLARWWHLVTFMKAMNLLHRGMHTVSYRHIVMAIETASKVGTCCIIVLLIVALSGSCRDNMERVVAQWRRPVASGEGWSSCNGIGQCAPYCFNASVWLSKWPATEAHLFVTAPFFTWCNPS